MEKKCVNNGAIQKWTDAQMLQALVRVQAMTGCCGLSQYDHHHLPTDPSARAIITRFRSWNRAKVQAGLPIQVKVTKRRSKRICDEETLPPIPRQSYPCWMCGNLFKGLGRRKGNWHCDTCTTILNYHASQMGW